MTTHPPSRRTDPRPWPGSPRGPSCMGGYNKAVQPFPALSLWCWTNREHGPRARCPSRRCTNRHGHHEGQAASWTTTTISCYDMGNTQVVPRPTANLQIKTTCKQTATRQCPSSNLSCPADLSRGWNLIGTFPLSKCDKHEHIYRRSNCSWRNLQWELLRCSVINFRTHRGATENRAGM